jgi:hypothetical protein
MKKFVVIGGMYRSGTTLTETIIGSHPDISIPPRDFTFFDYYKTGDSLKSVYQKLDQRDIWRRWKEEIRNKQDASSSVVPDFESFFEDEPGKAYIGTLTSYASSINKKIPGVKCPQNEFYFDIIKSWLAEFDLKFIHLIRNPFDMVASFQNSSYYGDTIKQNPANIAVHSRNWCRSASLGLARAFYDPKHYYLLRYEDLALEPRRTTERLCDFLEIDIDENKMLNAQDYEYYGSNTSFESQERSSTSEFVKAPKSRKNHLTGIQIKTIGSICGEIAHAMGYEDHDLQPSHPDRLKSLDPFLKKNIKRIAEYIVKKASG